MDEDGVAALRRNSHKGNQPGAMPNPVAIPGPRQSDQSVGSSAGCRTEPACELKVTGTGRGWARWCGSGRASRRWQAGSSHGYCSESGLGWDGCNRSNGNDGGSLPLPLAGDAVTGDKDAAGARKSLARLRPLQSFASLFAAAATERCHCCCYWSPTVAQTRSLYVTVGNAKLRRREVLSGSGGKVSR